MNRVIHLIGLNHKTADVTIRERYAIEDPERFNRELMECGLDEVMALSTCNRVEILVIGRDNQDVPDMVRSYWAEHCKQDRAPLVNQTYAHTDEEAITHLFNVAASLDSMVMGEAQILGQLKDAYRRALETGTARVIINRLLHKAFFTAKRVRTETGIASCAVSISYAAVELAKKIFGSLEGKKAMLVGAGEMAELAATHLLGGGVEHIFVANRTFTRAEELAAEYNGTPIAFDDIFCRLEEVDIVISSTAATSAIIRAKDLKKVLRKRKFRPMFFIDIAVPRDIDPDVNNLDNVYLYDIDDLEEVVEENRCQRQDEAVRAREIIQVQRDAFLVWQRSLELEPTIKDLLSSGQEIADRELAKTLKRLGPKISEEDREALQALVDSLAHKLYHEPITFLKRRVLEEGASGRFIDITRRMFNLDDDIVPMNAHADRKPGNIPPNPDCEPDQDSEETE